jgi:hypothetical protein
MEAKERVVAWGRESLANIRRGKWWLVFLPIALWFLGGLAEDRFFHSINAYLDAHAPAFFAELRAILTFKGPFALAGIGFAAVLIVLIFRAYLETQPGIVGTADLMLQELDIADLEIKPDFSSYEVNLAAFARIEVASLGRPRTVRSFEVEMIAPDGTVYRPTRNTKWAIISTSTMYRKGMDGDSQQLSAYGNRWRTWPQSYGFQFSRTRM